MVRNCSTNNHRVCNKCETDFVFFMEDTWWDYSGSTDTRLVKCPECNTIQAVQYIEPKNTNDDVRYYFSDRLNN